MKCYFSIGEVSKIKGVSIKSLRYYDRIGVLTPAYVNPDTGYRYYTIQQFSMIDMVLACVELGIPLKSIKDYFEDDQINIKKLFRDSRSIAIKKLHSIQTILQKINGALNEIQASEAYENLKGKYSREMPKRHILFAPYEDGYDNEKYEFALAQLYLKANELNVVPDYMVGLLYEFYPDSVQKNIFVEVLESGQNHMIKTIPSGTYQCHRSSDSMIEKSRDYFAPVFVQHENVLVFEVDTFREKVEFTHQFLEVQVFPFKPVKNFLLKPSAIE